ncbi:MAG TPA: sigma-54 dependent transcriptional regulator [Casimicrobiaceae bacterium]|nr:sigma-54 dependent transcriptional regulator [Casimicrobiaceae bacterium]
MSEQDLPGDNIVALPFVAARRAASAPALSRFGDLYGASPAMQEVYRRIAKVAPTMATVFITGESGSGKEIVAGTIHRRSERAELPFLAVNCGAIPGNLIEAELFGYEKGAFTGAARMHRGCFERAEGGTLFLDEVTEMAPEMQVRLLRVLESGRYTRVGGEQELRARVRVIAATNRDPQEAVRAGRLREDLMYRLAVFPIVVPPLRERDGDAELLAEHFLRQLNETEGTHKIFSHQAITVIRSHRWPGNVRELKNAVQRAHILSDDVVDIDFLGTPGAAPIGECLRVPVGTPLAEIERQAIHSTLDLCEGNKRRCAEMLGVSLKTLYNRLAEYQSAPAAAVSSV